MNRHPRVFPDLDPPPGGVAALRRRLSGSHPLRARLFVPALALSVVAALVVVSRAAPDPERALVVVLQDGRPVTPTVEPLGGGLAIVWLPPLDAARRAPMVPQTGARHE